MEGLDGALKSGDLRQLLHPLFGDVYLRWIDSGACYAIILDRSLGRSDVVMKIGQLGVAFRVSLVDDGSLGELDDEVKEDVDQKEKGGEESGGEVTDGSEDGEVVEVAVGEKRRANSAESDLNDDGKKVKVN
jgi:hypothetical protein